MFRGSIPALITPFDNELRVDEIALADFVEWQILQGSSGVVAVGTTGEASTLTHDEHKRVVEICLAVADKRVPVIAGAGSNNTAEAIDLARHAESIGASGLLIVTPYFNKPTGKGLLSHFSAIAEAVSIPIIIYNIPSRSVIDITPETMGLLVKSYGNIIGVKDATGKLERVSEQRITCGHDFIQLSGDDATALGFNAHGGIGCISVTANITPRLCADFQRYTLSHDYQNALKLQDRLVRLHKAIFMEPGVCGAKYALSRIRGMSRATRLPLLSSLDLATETAIDEALEYINKTN
ncbi:4-hydroxy-tetrahydrodipicolinate synthase [Brucella pseudogrignonensis]|uniref:4-hydroxy-tetrahydrodipicolinate synthase n=1 Tax=Brucella pseudogrignonensis TaxID=419475 RepID=UPI003D961F40